MTEDEAKTKWCPEVRFQIGPQNPTWQNIAYNNRGQEYEPKTCLCMASGCGWWKVGLIYKLFGSKSGHCRVINK